MDAHERPDAALAPLDDILRWLQELRSRMADEQLAERKSFEEQMTAFLIGKHERQTRREAIQDQVQGLQEELRVLDEQDKTGNDKARRLRSEYRGITEQQRRDQQTLQDRLLAAIPPQMVRLHLRYLTVLISV